MAARAERWDPAPLKQRNKPSGHLAEKTAAP